MVFDKSGKFLNTIGRFGQGPEEYSWLRQVCLTPDEKMLVIHGFNMKYYTLDGKFVKSSKGPYIFGNIQFITDNIIAGENSSGNVIDKNNPLYKPKLLVMDIASGKILYSAYQSYYREEFMSSSMYPLRKSYNQVLFNPLYTDTIYLVTPEGLYPRYHFKMKNMPPLVVNKNTTDKDVKDHIDRYYTFSGYIDMKDVIYFQFLPRTTNRPQFALYSKKQNKVFCSTGRYDNDPFFYYCYGPISKYKDNYLVFKVRPDIILRDKEHLYNSVKNLPPDKKKMLDELYKDLLEDDNLILMFYRVKI